MTVTLDTSQVKNWQHGGASGKVRFFLTKTVTTEDGAQYQKGDVPRIGAVSVNGFFTETTHTVAGSVLTIAAAAGLPVTESARDNPDATMTAAILDEDNRVKAFLFQNFRIPETLGPVVQLEDLVLHNNYGLPLRDTSVYNKTEVNLLVSNQLAGTGAPKATTLASGIGKLSSTAVDINDPIFVGTNDPEWIRQDKQTLNVREYATLAAAITAIGATATTLLIPSPVTVSVNLTIPSNVTLWFTGTGAINASDAAVVLTINGALEATPKQIFTGFTAGNVKLNSSGEGIYPQWFGAKGDYDGATGTDNYAAVTAAIKAATVPYGAQQAGQVLIFPRGQYYFSDTIRINNCFHIRGSGGGGWFVANTTLHFAAGKTGLYFEKLTVVGDTGDSDYSVIENLTIRAIGKSGSSADGIRAHARIVGRHLRIENFARNGFFLDSDANGFFTGNTNESALEYSTLTNNGTPAASGLLASMNSGSNVVTSSNGLFTADSWGTNVSIAGAKRINVTNATNATPIVITTASAHGVGLNESVTIASVTGNTAANGTWAVTRISDTTFSLNGSTGNGAYVSGGTATLPLYGQLYDITSPTTAKLAINGNLIVPTVLNADVTVTNAALTIMGHGWVNRSNNSTNCLAMGVDASLNQGSGFYDGGSYGSAFQANHTSGNQWYPYNIGMDSETTNTSVLTDCYTEIQKYPNRVRSPGAWWIGAEQGTGFTDDTTGNISHRSDFRMIGSKLKIGGSYADAMPAGLTVIAAGLASPVRALSSSPYIAADFQSQSNQNNDRTIAAYQYVNPNTNAKTAWMESFTTASSATGTAGYFEATGTGVNYGGYFTASGGTNNYGVFARGGASSDFVDVRGQGAPSVSAANFTFVDADVNAATDIITAAGHNLVTGAEVRLTTTGVLPAGLSLATNYYVIYVSSSTFKLASSLANAIAGTAVDITGASGGGTHTVQSATVRIYFDRTANQLLASTNGSAFSKVLTVTDFAAPGAIGGGTPAAGSFTTLSATGQVTSTLATGTAPLVIASTTKVANLNVDKLDDADWAAPAAIGSGTPAAGTFTTLGGTVVSASTSMAVGSGTALTKIVAYAPTLTPVAIAANTSAEQDFTVAGLATTDTVFLTGPAPLAGTAIVSYRVKATDTLSITFGNFTAGSLTPTSGVYKIIAVRS